MKLYSITCIAIILILIVLGVSYQLSSKKTVNKNTEGFLQLIKDNNFEKFDEKYPVIIDFTSNMSLNSPQERADDIQKQQENRFKEESQKYKFSEIESFEVTETKTKLGYEFGVDGTNKGKLIYKDKSTKEFTIYFSGSNIMAFSIDNTCLFNSKCTTK